MPLEMVLARVLLGWFIFVRAELFFADAPSTALGSDCIWMPPACFTCGYYGGGGRIIWVWPRFAPKTHFFDLGNRSPRNVHLCVPAKLFVANLFYDRSRIESSSILAADRRCVRSIRIDRNDDPAARVCYATNAPE